MALGEYADMKVTVTCFGALREFLPDPTTNSAVVEVAEGAQVSDVAEALEIPSRLLYVVLVDGDKAAAGTVVPEGAEVTLMPAFSGGAMTERESA